MIDSKAAWQEGTDVLRHAPVTLVYATILCGTSAARALWPEPLERAVSYSSTNIENLHDHPVRSLVFSAFFVDGSVPVHIPFGFVPMAICERRLGSPLTVFAFSVGHVGATLLTAATIRRGLRTGYYPQEVRTAPDVGMSYGGLAVRFAAIGALPPTASRRVEALRAGTLLSLTQPWRMPRDFSATGHTIAAAIGAALGVGIALGRRRRVT